MSKRFISDPVASPEVRRIVLPSIPLECGAVLRDPVVAFRFHGALNATRDNVVLVLHALTGSSDAAGGWWSGLIGPGAVIDTDRFAVVVPDLIGSCHAGVGPRVGGEPFPAISTRDQARAVGVLLEALCVPAVELVTGGSLGGMVALEFAASFPGRAAQAVVFAAPAQQTTWGIGWNAVQRELVSRHGAAGLGLARAVAMLTYRTPIGLQQRFGRRGDLITGQSEIAGWLGAHGERLRVRFDPESYLTLLGAMDTHDVGRGRGGVGERLRASGTAITGVGIPGDQLYPAAEIAAWARESGAAYREIISDHGHDAFLLERGQVGDVLAQALGRAARRAAVA